MADVVDSVTRSRMMSGIGTKNTRPEMIVRQGLHARGLRFRLHDKRLPGCPDLVLKKFRVVVFVHGCFWHGHNCRFFKIPQTRTAFWMDKIAGNQRRDEASVLALRKKGWRVLTIWECALRGRASGEIEETLNYLATWIAEDEDHADVRGSTTV